MNRTSSAPVLEEDRRYIKAKLPALFYIHSTYLIYSINSAMLACCNARPKNPSAVYTEDEEFVIISHKCASSSSKKKTSTSSSSTALRSNDNMIEMVDASLPLMLQQRAPRMNLSLGNGMKYRHFQQ
ncbi:hypothetical protein BGZ82_007167 [Podila clonocystis]|nr:hypothetical protein BGZ82_007167 [Podila clonocystis]